MGGSGRAATCKLICLGCGCFLTQTIHPGRGDGRGLIDSSIQCRAYINVIDIPAGIVNRSGSIHLKGDLDVILTGVGCKIYHSLLPLGVSMIPGRAPNEGVIYP